MTIATLTIFALTSGLVLLKLSLMALAAALMATMLFPRAKRFLPISSLATLPARARAWR